MLIDHDAKVAQLTTRGFHTVKVTKATILDADGLDFMGEGFSIYQPGDLDEPLVGVKLALTRATENVYPAFEKQERAKIFDAMLTGFRQVTGINNRAQEQVERYQAELRRYPQYSPVDPFGPGRMARTHGGYSE